MHIHTKQHASLYGTRAGDVQGRLGSSGSSRCACAYVGILLCSLVATSKPCRPSRHAHLWIRACLATLIQMHSWACTHLWLSLYLPTDVYRVQTWVVWVHQALNGAEGLNDAFSAAPTCKRRGHRAHSKVCDCMRMSKLQILCLVTLATVHETGTQLSEWNAQNTRHTTPGMYA